MALRLAGALLLLTFSIGCGSSSTNPPSSPTPTPGSMSVSIVSGSSTMTTTAYAPNPVTIATGGSITWTNNDTTAHTATDNNGGYNSGSIAPGGQFTRTFTTAGTYAYHCTLHPNMVGTVNVQ
jgi:plastocyanin